MCLMATVSRCIFIDCERLVSKQAAACDFLSKKHCGGTPLNCTVKCTVSFCNFLFFSFSGLEKDYSNLLEQNN